MASIGGLSSSTSNTITGLQGYGGLASGLDRDSLIEGMTLGTQTKIDKQNQAKQKLQWEMDAYREISTKMIEFAEKYTSTFTSSTNLFSSTFWGAANVTALGANSKFVSVLGNSSLANMISIVGVAQMAKNAAMTSGSAVSDRTLKTGTINIGPETVSNLAGKTINIKYGDKTYSVSLTEGEGESFDLTTPEGVAEAVNKKLSDVDVSFSDGTTKKLSELISAEVKDGKVAFVSKDDSGNGAQLTGGSALEYLGFEKNADGKWEGLEITADGLAGTKAMALTRLESFADRMGGKELTFNYNGTTKTITFPTADEIKAAGSEQKQLEYLKDQLQAGLDDAFGTGRIQVDVDSSNALSFKTTTPDGREDGSSILAVTGGSSELLGEQGSLHMQIGESNRLNRQTAIKDAGLAGFKEGLADADGNYKLTVNGKEVVFNEEDSLTDIMEKINSTEGLGVKISYMQQADKFVVESTVDGAAGKLELGGTGAEALFGITAGSNGNNVFTAGQDAVVGVRYEGSDEIVTLTRGSNSFDLEGLTVTVNGTFGEYDAGKDEWKTDTEAVTFDAKADTEKITKAVSELVKEYNEILELVNNQVSTRPEKGYAPLTAAQKKELSEDEVKLWEEKAKQGILYGSSELRSLSSDLRFIISPLQQLDMKEFGITVSDNWRDNGKLVFDEAKFKAALEKDPAAVQEAFTSKANEAKGTEDGFAVKLKDVLNKYVNTLGADESKGILIQKAGSTKVPTSILKNKLYDEMTAIDKIIAKLEAQLKSEQDRYIRQFTNLETVIAQMNAQSSYLSGMSF